MKNLYINLDIIADKAFIDKCAAKYIETRGGLHPSINSSVFVGTGFNIDKLKGIINKNTLPERPPVTANTKMHLDIYRSDLGEMLMTMFFEEELNQVSPGTKNFIIPIKNIWDRETNSQPGRGLDAVGYRLVDDKKPTLLLGEAKVSSDKKNPPGVVDSSHDSIYKTHIKHANDKKYLIQKLSNHCKKIDARHANYLYMIIMGIEDENPDLYDVVYGCCMVRDKSCFDMNKDFGKLKSESKNFDPNWVYFYIPTFDKEIENVVEEFYTEVNARA